MAFIRCMDGIGSLWTHGWNVVGWMLIEKTSMRVAAQAYRALRHAAGHMTMIANPLADAIAKQFPAKFTI
jgi:hypothetical protein